MCIAIFTKEGFSQSGRAVVLSTQHLHTGKLTASFPLKDNGLKTILSLSGWKLFRGYVEPWGCASTTKKKAPVMLLLGESGHLFPATRQLQSLFRGQQMDRQKSVPQKKRDLLSLTGVIKITNQDTIIWGNPSKLPCICCFFDPPKNIGTLMTPV